MLDGDAADAIPQLRRACQRWLELEAPYEAALVRAHLGAALAMGGDPTSAALELGAAVAGFERLGARPDAERIALGLGDSRTEFG
jgi:hypothetical protein